MKKKLVLKPQIIQKFKWGGTNIEWQEEASKLSNQLDTIDELNHMFPDGDIQKSK